jgi:hypothetical protein
MCFGWKSSSPGRCRLASADAQIGPDSRQIPLASPPPQSDRHGMDSSGDRSPVLSDHPDIRVERDEIGRAFWAESGKRITAAEVITCDEDGEPPEAVIDVLVRNGLWVVRDGQDVLVTWDGIERWIDEL